MATQPLQTDVSDTSGGGGSGSGGGKDMGSLGGERSNVIAAAAAAAGKDSSAVSDGGGAAALENVADVLRTMREMNEAQTVRNEEIFGPVTNETVVIAIQGLHVPSLLIN